LTLKYNAKLRRMGWSVRSRRWPSGNTAWYRERNWRISASGQAPSTIAFA
jgi:hypothetical protein